MSDFSFYWHDYETFGRTPRRDRPAQFAGVRTDAALNEIGEPRMIYCRPSDDSLPEPRACLLTGILPQHCLAEGLPEHAFAAEIEAELALPGTVGVGYNSIRFDDEVTRFLFWRNLIDPYAREWQNGCGRWDLLDVLRCAWALRPQGLEWPAHPDGRPSFKLEHLTAANGIGHAAAHDALSDVRATIALARRLREAQPRLWEFCLRLRQKDAVLAEVQRAQQAGRPLLHVSGMYGTERGCLALVWPLAPHPVNRNELIVWDLAQDPSELFGLRADAIRERVFARADALPEGVARLPVKTIHLNRSPIVIAELRTLGDAQAARWGLDLAQGLRHAAVAAREAPAFAGTWAEVYARPADAGAPRADVDEDLYGGFLSNDDRRTLQRLRHLAPHELAGRRPAFQDGRLDELLFRYRARNFPDTLDADEQARWQEHRAARLLDGAGGATTLEAFMHEVEELGDEYAEDERAQEILGALMDYATDIAPER
ncbi:exodeoxyribonuclease I [Piscinibacter sakaiensis]|uniref:Exodeoxyribonuclease I n=1 Tax=Piscinibacter sakaiensis TaxID=1547922 RepID=A0A0K8P1Q8_PISS1|nr:exodeoxyribonuclease I [Piscinibacter sakaiensis]GAP36597.1 exodeoxyribonuclease I [Piscinibacter sakaiensis]